MSNTCSKELLNFSERKGIASGTSLILALKQLFSLSLKSSGVTGTSMSVGGEKSTG